MTRALTLKQHLKILLAFVVCCNFLITLFNKVKHRDKQCRLRSDSDLGLQGLLERFLKHVSRRQNQTTQLFFLSYLFACYVGYLLSRISSECQTIYTQTRPQGYKTFSCSTQLSTNFQLLIKTKMLKNKVFSCFQTFSNC